MKRLRRVISKQSTAATSPVQVSSPDPAQADHHHHYHHHHHHHQQHVVEHVEQVEPLGDLPSAAASSEKDPSFLSFLNRTSLRRPTMHRSTQSFSSPNTTSSSRDWRHLRDISLTGSGGGSPTSKHKRTLSSILPLAPLPIAALHRQNQAHQMQQQLQQEEWQKLRTKKPVFIGYPPGGLETQQTNGLVLLCEQKSPDICEYTVRRDSAGLRFSDILAVGLVSWAAHIFFRGPLFLALLPMAVYLVRSSLQVYQESLVVIRNVGIQTETVTLAGFRNVRSHGVLQMEDLVVHEALQLFEYKYYMAIIPKDPGHSIVIMFPHLLPKLDALLPAYHGARQLLFSDKDKKNPMKFVKE